MTDIGIIGSGWYGLHVANLLKNKFNVTLLEKDSKIFGRSSYYNQNRLHLGYHYCRDYKTRNLCQRNFDRFVEKYSSTIDSIENNYYMISDSSIIDYETYKSIFSHEKFDFDEIENQTFTGIEKNIINTKEGVINSDKARDYFQNNLDNINLILNANVKSIVKNCDKIKVLYNEDVELKFDMVFNCTFDELKISDNDNTYELTISLLYERINETIFNGITIMDGKFFSLYPRDIKNNIFTLTDVEYTPLLSSKNESDFIGFELTNEIEEKTKEKFTNKVLNYYKEFNDNFEYRGYFLSRKVKPKTATDSRNISIENNDGIISVSCGKIYGIFDFEDYIKEILNFN